MESKAPQPMGPWLGGGESTAQAQPPLVFGGEVVGGKLVKIGWQVEIRCYRVDLGWRDKNGLGNMQGLNESTL